MHPLNDWIVVLDDGTTYSGAINSSVRLLTAEGLGMLDDGADPSHLTGTQHVKKIGVAELLTHYLSTGGGHGSKG